MRNQRIPFELPTLHYAVFQHHPSWHLNHQRMDARLEMLIQAELIAGWLQGDHGLSEEKAANWNRLLSVLSKTALCFTEMEDDMLRSRTIISELRAEARSDAESCLFCARQ